MANGWERWEEIEKAADQLGFKFDIERDSRKVVQAIHLIRPNSTTFSTCGTPDEVLEFLMREAEENPDDSEYQRIVGEALDHRATWRQSTGLYSWERWDLRRGLKYSCWLLPNLNWHWEVRTKRGRVFAEGEAQGSHDAREAADRSMNRP